MKTPTTNNSINVRREIAPISNFLRIVPIDRESRLLSSEIEIVIVSEHGGSAFAAPVYVTHYPLLLSQAPSDLCEQMPQLVLPCPQHFLI